MTATNPPSTATNLTATTLLAALKAGGGTTIIYAYSDTVNQAPGFTAGAAEALLPVPGAATGITAQQLADLLSTPGTNKLFVYEHASDTRSPGFNASAAQATVRDSFDPYSGAATYDTRVEFQQGARVYTRSGDVFTYTGTILPVDTELVIYRTAYRQPSQLWFLIASGPYVGDYVRYEEIRLPDSSL